MSALGWISAVAGALVVLAGAWTKIGKPAWRIVRRFVHFIDDVTGEPARAGVPARPGVMERLESIDTRLVEHGQRLTAIEHELHPNDGHSLRDVADRIEQAVVTDEMR